MRSEGRVRRFLQRHRARGLHVVILSEDVSLERTMELRRALGPLWNARKITFRSGIPPKESPPQSQKVLYTHVKDKRHILIYKVVALLKELSAHRGEIALGVRLESGAIELSPIQHKTYILKETDDLIVLVREDAA